MNICGLSREEAARFLDVPTGLIDTWCQGGSSAPPRAAWIMLADLFERLSVLSEDVYLFNTPSDFDPQEMNNFILDDDDGEAVPGKRLSRAAALAALNLFAGDRAY